MNQNNKEFGKHSSIYFLNKNKQFVCLFLLLVNMVNGQYKISGMVLSDANIPLYLSNIQIQNTTDHRTISFCTSEQNGSFLLELKEKGIYNLKITALGYKSQLTEIEVKSSLLSLGIVILKEDKTELEEVLIKANSNGITQKGDTTFYKVERFLNGNEENLRDVIKRIPGLDINAKGKITSNGKEVDKLLIDGDNLYKNQHQFATENVSSKMIKNIELIKNYNDFESINNDKKTGITALNIKIKEDYKNNITGQVEGHIGYNQKQKINVSIFNFRKKTKTSIISNFNNLGETPISFEDYFNLLEKEDDSNSNDQVTFTNPNEIPRFLSSSNNVSYRKNTFTTLSSIFKPSKKTKLDFFVILNKADQNEELLKKQEFSTSNGTIANTESNKINEINYFAILQLKTIYKQNENTLFKISSTLNFDYSNRINSIENFTTTDSKLIGENNFPKKISSFNTFNFTKKVNSKSIFKSDVFLNLNNQDLKSEINSNVPFLELPFKGFNYYIKQDTRKKTNQFGCKLNYNLSFKKVSFDFNLGSSLENESYYNSAEGFDDFTNSLKLRTISDKIGLESTYKFSEIFSYSAGLNYNYLERTFNESFSSLNFLGFTNTLKAVFNNNKIARFSYLYSNSKASIDYFLEKKIIVDYRNTMANDDVKFYDLFPYNILNFNYFYFSTTSKYSIIFNASYNFKNKSTGENSTTNFSETVTNTKVINSEKITSAMLFFEKELKNKPFAFANSFSYVLQTKDNYTEDLKNPFSNNSISNYSVVNSRFKKSVVNFDLGFKFTYDFFKNTDNNSSITSSETTLNLNGYFFKNFYWRLGFSFVQNRLSGFDSDIFSLSPRIRYSRQKSKWEFFINTNNILSLNNQKMLENKSTSVFFEERITSTLAGYITVGLKYKL
jgi:hypothetical protein